ncbi:hypothetical protein NC651_040268 [Populus alba x Populus x berolinensis]|nr:hypothetical protein NC651_040268 [Populus alba x Populus x berolinensis]
MIMAMASYPPPCVDMDGDSIYCTNCTSGNFSIQSAYATEVETLRHRHDQASLWKLIWKWNGPERIKAFLWIVAHSSLIQNETKGRRHFAEDPY